MLGAGLLGAAVLPLQRLLLRNAEPALSVADFVQTGSVDTLLVVAGAALVTTLAFLMAFAGRRAGPAVPWRRLLTWIHDRSESRWVVACGLIGGGVTLAFSLGMLEGKPHLVDAMSQLLHARYVAAGELAGAVPQPLEFFDFQYMVETPAGWVSQYPPGHVVLLGLATALGTPWLLGPLLVAVTAVFSGLAWRRLFPDRSVEARIAALLTAVSPFLVGLAGAYMNHVTAAAMLSVALWGALRAREGSAGWAVLAGAAAGVAFAARPLTGLLLGASILIGVGWSVERRSTRHTLSRALLCVAGWAPFAVGVAWFNAHFFGSPFRFGYSAAQGELHGLGYHTDPWGASFGPHDALAFVATELKALGLELLQTPLSVVALVGLWLVLRPALRRAHVVVIVWALMPSLAGLVYWHHDLTMGPRMVNEAAPAWVFLGVLAASDLFRLWHRRPLPFLGDGGAGRVLTAAYVLSLAGALVFGPMRLYGYGSTARSVNDAPGIADIPAGALVFVHGSWESRLGARLAAMGLREDSVRMALAHNTSCDVQSALDDGDVRRLAFASRAALVERVMPSGSVVRTRAGESLTAACEREARSDFRGTVGLPQLLWQGRLPGLEPSEPRPLFARDLGPGANQRLLARYPDLSPLLMYRPAPDARPVVVSLGEGETALWSESAEPDDARPDGAMP